MARSATIVMYHYVRELRSSRYPEIKGLSIDDFKGQIKYIKKHYNVISADDLMDAAENDAELPPQALLLTFDDGYLDHFINVFPILDAEKLPGCFFPPVKCILERQVLDVNKIHFILASTADKNQLVDYIDRTVDARRAADGLQSRDYYWQMCAIANRFDPAEVLYIKRMLQRELPEQLRNQIIDELFRKYVSADEQAFAQELYMNADQIACLQRNGMYVGNHGYDHYWLNTLTEAQQQREIELSLQFLQSIGSDTQRWMMCYPYGAYNEQLLTLLRQRCCVAGVTTQVGIADLQQDCALTLPRFDTNDLPVNV